VMIRGEDYSRWLSPSTGDSDVRALVAPYAGKEMRAWEVGLLVNDPKTDDARVLSPVSD